MESSFTESIARLNSIDLVALALLGSLVLFFALSRQVHSLMFLFVLSATLVGTTFPILGDVAPILRWLIIFVFLILGILNAKLAVSPGLILYWGYVLCGHIFLFNAIGIQYQLQKSVLLIIVALSIPLLFSARPYRSLDQSLKAIAVAGSIFCLLNFVSLPSFLADPARFTGYTRGAASLAIFLGGLLPFTLWGVWKTTRWARILCAFGFLAGMVTLIFSGQRTGTLIGIVGIIPLFIFMQNRKTIVWSLILLAATVTIGMVLFQHSSQARTEYLVYRFFNGQSGFSGREHIWRLALNEIRTLPAIGRGIGAAELFFSPSFHNTYLEVWYNTGPFGLVFFILSQAYFLYKAARLTWSARDQHIRSASALALGYMTGYIAMGFMESMGAGSSSINIILYLFLSLLVTNSTTLSPATAALSTAVEPAPPMQNALTGYLGASGHAQIDTYGRGVRANNPKISSNIEIKMDQGKRRRWIGRGGGLCLLLLAFACSGQDVTAIRPISQTQPPPAYNQTSQVQVNLSSLPNNGAGGLLETPAPSLTPEAELGPTPILPGNRSLPPQGLYESCMPEQPDCLNRLSEMAARGFKVVLNDGLRYAAAAADIQSYADHAARSGMQIILPIKYFPTWDADDAHLVKEFPELALEGGCTDNKSFLTYYINSIKDHPALWGYYIADEVHSEYHLGLSYYSNFVKSIDPDHPRLIVEEATNDPMEIFFTFPSFMRDTTDVLAVDNYPYGYIDPFDTITRFTGESARMLQLWAEKNALSSAIVLQAFAAPQYYPNTPLCSPWPHCASFPTSAQMKAQRDQALQFSDPQLILWFSYPDILRSDNPRQHWLDLVEAAFSPLPDLLPQTAPRAQVCPPGWTCEDIGAPMREGTQDLSGSAWQIEACGWDIWSQEFVKADQFRFVWQKMAANGEIEVQITSQSGGSLNRKSGIMLRKTFDPVSPYYAVLYSPGSGLLVQYRPEFRQDPILIASHPADLPIYIKIVSDKNLYSAYFGSGGAAWTQIPGSSIEIPALDQESIAGLVVTSGDAETLSVAEFDHLSITTPAP